MIGSCYFWINVEVRTQSFQADVSPPLDAEGALYGLLQEHAGDARFKAVSAAGR
ncbi:hypothetical protein D3C73_1488150 [compost metagenome]